MMGMEVTYLQHFFFKLSNCHKYFELVHLAFPIEAYLFLK